jgi:prophage regulatory protein
MDLMGAQEVAELLGVSRQRVHQLAERPDFPAPVAVLAAGKIWRDEE